MHMQTQTHNRTTHFLATAALIKLIARSTIIVCVVQRTFLLLETTQTSAVVLQKKLHKLFAFPWKCSSLLCGSTYRLNYVHKHLLPTL
jgi:hypothetical protein